MKKNILTVLCLMLSMALWGCSGEKEEAYRMIQVLEVSGSVSVERQSMGAMDAYEGMRLESGDKITVGTDSWLKMKMDEDKYALAEPNSVLRLEASGSSADSKTVLHLETGAVSNRLEEKLSEASSYEVNTPNSTMAVRGTVFRVEVVVNEEGVSISNVSVYGGSVASRLIHPDGSIDAQEDAVLIVDGAAAQIWGNDVLSEYVITDQELKLDDLRLKTLEFLKEARDAGEELTISPEELDELIDALEQQPESDQPEDVITVPTEAATEPVEETTAPTTTPTTPKPTTPAATDPPETDPPATQAPTTEPTEETEPPSYTVTFRYGDSVFATQSVVSGETAVEPKLQPTAAGSWDFAFTTPITQDTVVLWSAN